MSRMSKEEIEKADLFCSSIIDKTNQDLQASNLSNIERLAAIICLSTHYFASFILNTAANMRDANAESLVEEISRMNATSLMRALFYGHLNGATEKTTQILTGLIPKDTVQ